MENRNKKKVVEPNHEKKELDADDLDTLIEPLDELDLEDPQLDEIDDYES